MDDDTREARLAELVDKMSREVHERFQIVPKAGEHIKNVISVLSEFAGTINKSLDKETYKIIVLSTKNRILVTINAIEGDALVNRDQVLIEWFNDPLTLRAFKANSEHSELFVAVAKLALDGSLNWQVGERDALLDMDELALIVFDEVISTFCA